MRQLTLEDRYLVDTSSFVDVRLEQDPDAVWDGLFGLVEAGRLFTVSYVFPELERMVATDKLPGAVFSRLKEQKRRIVIPDEQIITEAGRINHQYPRLGDWRDPRNRADPWIVAAAKVGGHIVVTEEADTGLRKTHRIPWTCDQENINWMRLSRLVVVEKLLAAPDMTDV